MQYLLQILTPTLSPKTKTKKNEMKKEKEKKEPNTQLTHMTIHVGKYSIYFGLFGVWGVILL